MFSLQMFARSNGVEMGYNNGQRSNAQFAVQAGLKSQNLRLHSERLSVWYLE